MKQNRILQNRTFMCSGSGYSLKIQYQEHISPENQIEIAYQARLKEYAGLSESVIKAHDDQEEKRLIGKMEAVFELLQALKNIRSQASSPSLPQDERAGARAAH